MNKKTFQICDLPVFTPQCQKIARHLLAEIKNGTYKPGEKLKSIREIAGQYGVGRQIVFSAFQILAKNNLIYTETGSGTFVNPNLLTGRNFRIGLFLNRTNPANAGRIIEALREETAKRHYDLLLGSNYEEDFSAADWICKKELDGVILDGMIDERYLKKIAVLNIPYVVLGNYDVSDEHPQVTVDLGKMIRLKLPKALKKSGAKVVAAFSGALEFKADREVVQGIKASIRDAGLKLYDNLICNTSGDGYAELSYLFETAMPRPDVVYFHVDHNMALSKYLEVHPGFKRPSIIINSRISNRISRDLWDMSINYGFSYPAFCRSAVKKLLEQIEGKK